MMASCRCHLCIGCPSNSSNTTFTARNVIAYGLALFQGWCDVVSWIRWGIFVGPVSGNLIKVSLDLVSPSLLEENEDCGIFQLDNGNYAGSGCTPEFWLVLLAILSSLSGVWVWHVVRDWVCSSHSRWYGYSGTMTGAFSFLMLLGVDIGYLDNRDYPGLVILASVAVGAVGLLAMDPRAFVKTVTAGCTGTTMGVADCVWAWISEGKMTPKQRQQTLKGVLLVFHYFAGALFGSTYVHFLGEHAMNFLPASVLMGVCCVYHDYKEARVKVQEEEKEVAVKKESAKGDGTTNLENGQTESKDPGTDEGTESNGDNLQVAMASAEAEAPSSGSTDSTQPSNSDTVPTKTEADAESGRMGSDSKEGPGKTQETDTDMASTHAPSSGGADTLEPQPNQPSTKEEANVETERMENETKEDPEKNQETQAGGTSLQVATASADADPPPSGSIDPHPPKPKKLSTKTKARMTLAVGLCVSTGWTDTVGFVRFYVMPGRVTETVVMTGNVVEYANIRQGGVSSDRPIVLALAFVCIFIGHIMWHVFEKYAPAAPASTQASIGLIVILGFDIWAYYQGLSQSDYSVLMLCVVQGAMNSIGRTSWLDFNTGSATGNAFRFSEMFWVYLTAPKKFTRKRRLMSLVLLVSVVAYFVGCLLAALYMLHVGLTTFAVMPAAAVFVAGGIVYDVASSRIRSDQLELKEMAAPSAN